MGQAGMLVKRLMLPQNDWTLGWVQALKLLAQSQALFCLAEDSLQGHWQRPSPGRSQGLLQA